MTSAPAQATAASRVDHLVVLAANLAEGAAWCEATLGIVPGPGGEHPLMGTHNRLFKIASAAFPRAYFEIIAIDPVAVPARPAGARRWFDMDDEALRERVARSGPQLVHFVAQCPDIAAAVAALQAQGIDRGRVLEASRPTPAGLLQWRISVRDDGQRLHGGALPTLIEWGPTHPADAMPDSGVTLEALTLSGPEPTLLAQACAAIGLALPVQPGPPGLRAEFATPRGRVALQSF